MELSVKRMSLSCCRTCLPLSLLKAAFQVSPSLTATSPPMEYSSAVKCQPPVLLLL